MPHRPTGKIVVIFQHREPRSVGHLLRVGTNPRPGPRRRRVRSARSRRSGRGTIFSTWRGGKSLAQPRRAPAPTWPTSEWRDQHCGAAHGGNFPGDAAKVASEQRRFISSPSPRQQNQAHCPTKWCARVSPVRSAAGPGRRAPAPGPTRNAPCGPRRGGAAPGGVGDPQWDPSPRLDVFFSSRSTRPAPVGQGEDAHQPRRYRPRRCRQVDHHRSLDLQMRRH